MDSFETSTKMNLILFFNTKFNFMLMKDRECKQRISI